MDKLPVELLDDILSFLDPPSPYCLKQTAALYACCLVSKRVKEVAQPLLWRAVLVDKKGEFEAVKREVAAGELGRHIRIFQADGRAVKATEVNTLVQSLPGLAEVRLRNFEVVMSNAVDGLLPHLKHLRRITLSATDFLDIKTPFPFNNLSSLSLCKVHITESFLSILLQPQYLPVLRSLRLSNLSEDRMFRFLPSFSNAFLRQLDILQLPLEAIHLTSLEVIQHPTTLFSGTIRDLREYLFVGIRPALIKNLHIRPDGLQAELPHSAIGTLQYMHGYARVVPGKLAVFIPSSGIPTLLLPILLQQLALTAACDKLLAACRTNGIEVLWEDEAGAGEEDVFSAEFRRWVVKKKRDEARRAS